MTCIRNAESAVGRGNCVMADGRTCLETRLKHVEQADLKLAEWRAVVEGAAPRLLEWIANGSNARDARSLKQRPTHCGEEVSVLMCIEMSYRNSRGLQSADLGECFSQDVELAYLASSHGTGEDE